MFYLGPVIGSGLYSLGGFLLPFVTIGSIGIILAICLFFAIPSGEYDIQEDCNDLKTKKLTWSGVFQVHYRDETLEYYTSSCINSILNTLYKWYRSLIIFVSYLVTQDMFVLCGQPYLFYGYRNDRINA